MTATLYVGNRNYSSWSLRGTLLVRQSGIECEEIVIPLDMPESGKRLEEISPTALVPVLHYDDLVIWESLAIAEFLHEQVPYAGLWPDDASARALARSVCAEMHAGFAALRRELPMDMRASRPTEHAALSARARADIERIQAIWSECRRRHGKGGDFLFAQWSAADAMFAPVVSRFRTYGIDLSPVAERYADAVWAWPDVQSVLAEARAEPWQLDLSMQP